MKNKKTQWEQHQEMRLQRDMPNVKWTARVVNQEETKTLGFKVISDYTEEDGLDTVAHKIKLDLITNLLHGFEKPILVQIKKVE